MDLQHELRREFKLALKREKRRERRLQAAGVPRYAWIEYGIYEDRARFAELKCGARTRAGTPCKKTNLYACGRCRLHGGLSTGPRTEAGKSVSRLNGLLSKRTP